MTTRRRSWRSRKRWRRPGSRRSGKSSRESELFPLGHEESSVTCQMKAPVITLSMPLTDGFGARINCSSRDLLSQDWSVALSLSAAAAKATTPRNKCGAMQPTAIVRHRLPQRSTTTHLPSSGSAIVTRHRVHSEDIGYAPPLPRKLACSVRSPRSAFLVVSVPTTWRESIQGQRLPASSSPRQACGR